MECGDGRAWRQRMMVRGTIGAGFLRCRVGKWRELLLCR